MTLPAFGWKNDSPPDISATNLEASLAAVGAYIDGKTFLSVKEPPYNAKGDGVTDDTAAINAALALAGVGGTEAVVYFPLGDYLTSASLKVPANVRILGAGMYRTRVYANGNYDLFQFTEGNNAVEHLYVESKTKQSAGCSAFDLSHGFSANIRFRYIKLGHKFYNGFFCVGSSSLIGGLHFHEIHFLAWDKGVQEYGGAAMVIGSTSCRVAGVWIRDFHGQANENKDMPRWFDVNNTDSLFAAQIGMQNMKEGFVVGANDGSSLKTTGMKIEGAWADSVPTEPTVLGWKIEKCFDLQMAQCNAQNCIEGAFFGNEAFGVAWTSGTVQSNRRHGIRISPTVGSITLCAGLTVTDNNAEGATGAGEGAGIYLEAGCSNVTIGFGLKSGNFYAQGQKQRYGVRIGASATSKCIFISGAILPETGTKPAGGPIRENVVKAVLNEQTGTTGEQEARGILIGASPINLYR